MSIWSTSTGRNSVLGGENSGRAVLPFLPSHLPINIHVAHAHLRNSDDHCFHKRYHIYQHPLVFVIRGTFDKFSHWHQHCYQSPSTMSQSGDGLHTPGYLSWRKLQLSRAKLKASSKTSALLSGFAMVAMVEVQLNSDTKVPGEMLIAFAVCTTLLVAVHMLALMISTCILPNIEAVCNLHSISLVHESPHERLHWYIEVAWASSTLLGLLLFLLEIAILCWVKFYDFSQAAAWSACILLIPVLIIFLAFAIHFYRSLVAHKYEVTVSGIRELELLKEQIESTDVEGRNGVNTQAAGVTHIV
ncbi:calcium release-activated calcium channel protein 1 isoform X1 [Harpegnathos saltator]|nr:calcium release-activated calcium channel protein 1 isoform X1 [Harpegnathos saltator]XP_025158398.1 calcium release-activated calcium channel protein 1 isoform X1 [Harpegnathos saltator]XP_025158399.1 calcium release-activated calcium channel protein 1 isoform X1 [Harpegnathos saltator]XP_025158400.1 calcium release-activated calcium channel protein 1 isoform X1 [Harpegnathos saltator]XP_025158401.1 calcium release-activated calcium channel protein 1 isoform X1 [Harpegnathos saltator]XP_02